MSTKNAGLAKKLGYRNIKVMLQGVPGWKKAGQPVYASQQYLLTGNNVIIDLRNPEEAAAGHIPRAVNIPLASLAKRENDFPEKKAAPFVLYGNADQAGIAAKILKNWGYKTISMVDGGVEGWRQAGNDVETGPAATEIHWVRKLGKEEVSIGDFLAAANQESSEKIILDVRTEEEVAEGKFPSALHIPLDEIPSRLSELPKGKDILVHCTTGARAEMATKELSNAGYTSHFLLATVECAGNDCSVEE